MFDLTVGPADVTGTGQVDLAQSEPEDPIVAADLTITADAYQLLLDISVTDANILAFTITGTATRSFNGVPVSCTFDDFPVISSAAEYLGACGF